MRALLLLCGLTIYELIFSAQALTCRSEGGPKEEELKTIYMNCLKSQDGRNSSDNRGHSDDQSSKERRKHNKGSKWDRRDDSFGNRDEWSGGDWSRHRDRSTPGRDRDDWSERDERMPTRNDRMSGRDRTNMSSRERTNMNSRDRMSDRDEQAESDDYDSQPVKLVLNLLQDMSTSMRNNYRSTTPPPYPRRMKREKSSGHRSQYNPNTSQKKTDNDDSDRNTERNSTDNNTNKYMDKNKACALHCFMEELEMTGENGMPDRYLVTQGITKDVKNEDLRDFLQESIEECFQILYNENTQDKCEFSKSLMMCLSEKGRANCDDWKEDIKF